MSDNQPHPVIKVAAALRVLTYECPADLIDVVFGIVELTVNELVRHFVKAMIAGNESTCLQLSRHEDITSVLTVNAAVAFLEC